MNVTLLCLQLLQTERGSLLFWCTDWRRLLVNHLSPTNHSFQPLVLLELQANMYEN